MKEKNISIEKIKAILSMISMALLAIQHFVGLFANEINISYIPLSITFFTIFIGTIGVNKIKAIKWISLLTTVLIVLFGCIVYTISGYDIIIEETIHKIYMKIMFGCIGVLSLILSILYVRQICESK